MNRRQFLASLGVAAGAIALNGVPLPTAADDTALDLPLKRGDIITFAGHYAFNPVTRRPTEHLQQFIVTAVTSEGATLHPRPQIRVSTRIS